MASDDESNREKVLLAAILDSAGYAIITLNRANEITSWNTGAKQILGWPEDEVRGRSGALIFTPEDRAAGAPEAEIQTALAAGCAEDDRWHVRKDGTRFWARGLMTPLNHKLGYLKIMRDETDRHLAEQALRTSEERFRSLAENIPQLVFRSQSMGKRTWGSPQWIAFTGLSEANSLGLGWMDAVHSADREATLEAWAAAETTGKLYVEHRIRRAIDGQHRWFQTRAKRLPDNNLGIGSEWFGTSTDIDDLRSLKERQQVLLKELHHRTGNLLTVVSSISRRTAQSSATVAEFSERFEGRIQALSRVQSHIAKERIPELDLGELVRIELDALGVLEKDVVQIDGPQYALNSRQAETLALAIHELATNALKYGALAKAGGKLSVTWQCNNGIGQLEWRETGLSGLTPSVAERRGYGRELIEIALPYALGAQTRFEIEPEQGQVYCWIELPSIERSETAAASPR